MTVNGKVILDGDIRKACKGHNVAPDGSDHNPYTVDHKNHPGLFNKEGYISFCGHGPGIMFRNVRNVQKRAHSRPQQEVGKTLTHNEKAALERQQKQSHQHTHAC